VTDHKTITTADELYRSFDLYRIPLDTDGTPFASLASFRDAAFADDTWVGWCENYDGHWLVAGWEEARQVFRNPGTFSSEVPLVPPRMTPSGRPLMLTGYDGQQHMKYRRLVQEAFSSPAVAQLHDEFVAETRDLISAFKSLERVDLAHELATRFAHTVVSRLTGLPLEESDKFESWVHAITHESEFGEESTAQLAAMKSRFDELLAERRRSPSDDVMSQLINSGVIDGEALTYDDLVDFFTVFIVGSIENTSMLLADLCWLLAQRPELRRQLRAEPELYGPFVDEALRYFTPASGGARTATSDVELGGVTIKAGDKVFPYLPLIDRDPREFDDPDAFVATRTPNRAFALSFGPHRCLGANLVRVELEAVIKTLLEELPEFALDPDASSTWTTSHVSGMVSVPVLLGERT
jgi:cytochrome P450